MTYVQPRQLDTSINFNDKSQCRPMEIDVVISPKLHRTVKVMEMCDEADYYGLRNQEGEEETLWEDTTIKLDVYDIDGYPHSVRGDGAISTTYACISGTDPSVESLLPFDRDNWTPWSYMVDSDVSQGKHGWRAGYMARVYRNNKLFNEEWRSTADGARKYCEAFIDQATEFYGADLINKNWREEIKDKPFLWKGIPLTVDYVIDGQAALVTNEKIQWDGEFDTVKLDLFGSDINWFPEYADDDKEDDEWDGKVRLVKIAQKLSSGEQRAIDEYHAEQKKKEATQPLPEKRLKLIALGIIKPLFLGKKKDDVIRP